MKRIIYTLLGIMLTTGAWAEGVAKIGATEYATLQEAFDAAEAGQTVQLLADVKLADWLSVKGTNVTLDLNGHTIAPTDDHVKINYCIILVHRGAKLTIDDTSVGQTGCIDGGTGTNAYYGGVLLTKNDDTGSEPATLIVNNGTIRGEQAAITGNGTRHNTNVTINGGTFIATSEVAGSEGCAIYHPQNGTLTINGGTFTGYCSAVEIRSGTLNITGGSFTATATSYSCNPNGNGTSTIGAALAIAQHTTKKDISVNISGGTFTGVKAVSEANPQGNDSPQITLTITDGTFTGEVSSVDVSHFVSGGTFSTAVDEGYCASGFEVVRDAEGHYVAKAETAIEAKIGDVKYSTLDAAITAATASQTITILTDATATVELPADVTIDAASHALTLPTFNVTDGQAPAYHNVTNAATYNVTTATYTRTMPTSTQWGTVCVPFTLKQGNGTDAPKLYTFGSISDETLTVTEVEAEVAPGTPVIFSYTGVPTVVFCTTDATVNSAAPATTGTLIGTYSSTKIETDLTSIYYINGNAFHQAKASLTVPAYRAYINYSASSGAKPSVLSLFIDDDETTGVEAAMAEKATPQSICDINGRLLAAPQKGINILKLTNGKTVKLVVK